MTSHYIWVSSDWQSRWHTDVQDYPVDPDKSATYQGLVKFTHLWLLFGGADSPLRL